MRIWAFYWETKKEQYWWATYYSVLCLSPTSFPTLLGTHTKTHKDTHIETHTDTHTNTFSILNQINYKTVSQMILWDWDKIQNSVFYVIFLNEVLILWHSALWRLSRHHIHIAKKMTAEDSFGSVCKMSGREKRFTLTNAVLSQWEGLFMVVDNTEIVSLVVTVYLS